MLKYIEEFGKYVEITGFRKVKINDVEEFLKTISKEKLQKVDIQFLDAELVATWQHLYFAVLNALTAFKNRENISKSLSIEMILYASAQRQIRKAMELLGIKPDSQQVAVVIIGEKPQTVKSALSIVSKHIKAQHDDTVLEFTKGKATLLKKTFKISDVELETVMKRDRKEKALTDLVIERMALLATEH